MKNPFPLWHKLFLLSAFIVIGGGALCFLIIYALHSMILSAFMLLFSNHMAHLILRVAKRDYLKEKAQGRATHKGEVIFSGVDFLPYHLSEALIRRKEKWEDALKGGTAYFALEDFTKSKSFKLLKKNDATFLYFENRQYPIQLADLSKSDSNPLWGWGLLGHYKSQPIYQYLLLKDNIFSYDSVVLKSEFPPDKGLVWQQLMYKLDEIMNLKKAMDVSV